MAVVVTLGGGTTAFAQAGPSNDLFVDAVVLPADGTVLGTNVDATKESGEPDHAGNVGGASVWYRWTAPWDGLLSVDTFGSDFDTTLALYTGTAVDALTEIASSDNVVDLQSELKDVAVVQGTTYNIAVDGFDGATGQIDLHWSLFTGTTFSEVTPSADPLWVTDADHDFWMNAAAPADVDGDGDLDLAVIGFFVEYNVSAEDRLVVFMNDGPDVDGNWTFTHQEVPLGDVFAGASDLAWGDYDGDGDPDLAVASDGVTVLYRNDAGTLVLINTDLPGYFEDSGYTGAYDLRSLTWADADNDGDLDLLVPSTFDFDTFTFGTRLMRNDGDDGLGGWSFVDSGAVIDGTVHAQSAWADDDGDGDLDLFLANVDNFTGNGFIRTYRNDGGVFLMEEPIGSVAIDYGLADWGDYDGDGDLDILAVGLIEEADGTFNTVLRIYDNEAGVYVGNTIIESNFFPWLDLHAATWADYDSDGDVDLLVTGSVIGDVDIEGRSEVYVNEGGEFVPLGQGLPAPFGSVGRGGSFTWFDIDGDADLDYFVAGGYFVPDGNGLVEAQMHLYRNDAPAVNAPPTEATGLQATVEGDAVSLSWNPAVDDTTPTEALTYDLEIRPAGDPGAGIRRRLPEPGNVSAVTSWLLRGLPPGSYTWSIRAVDSAFNGGPAAEGTFTIAGSTVGGTLTNARGLAARCRNAASGQLVGTPFVDGAWDCTAAGLTGQQGDRVQVRLATGATGADPVGGTVTGIRLAGGRCRNVATGATAAAAVSSAGSWSCAALPVQRTDAVEVVLAGRMTL